MPDFRRIAGFEIDDTITQADNWTYTGTTAISAVTSHKVGTFGGSQSLRIPLGSTASVPAVSVTNGEEVAFAINFDSGGGWIVRFRLSGGANCTVAMGAADGLIRLYRGTNTGVLLATGTNPLTHSTWYWIVCKITAKDSPNGAMEVLVNGVSEVSVSGVDTRNTITGDHFDSVYFANSAAGFYLDDYHQSAAGVLSALPAQHVFRWLPTGDDTITSTSSGGGAGTYANVDEYGPVSTADYNEWTAAGADLLSGADSMSPSEVTCVRMMAYMTGDGAITTARNNLKLGGTTENGTYQALSTGGTYAVIADIFETVGGLPLSGSDVDAMLHGVQVA